MIATKREKYIAVGTGAAVALLILNSFIVTPYFDQVASVAQQHDTALQQLKDGQGTLDHQIQLQKAWTVIQKNGLKSDEAAADSQLQHAMLDWAQLAGVNPQVLKSDQPRKEGDFEVIGYRVTATGSMRSISRFLWALETATIPVRVSDLRVTPQREGTDDLSVQLGVSTLCAPPGAAAKPAAAPARPSTTPAAPTRPAAPMTAPSRPTAGISAHPQFGAAQFTGAES